MSKQIQNKNDLKSFKHLVVFWIKNDLSDLAVVFLQESLKHNGWNKPVTIHLKELEKSEEQSKSLWTPEWVDEFFKYAKAMLPPDVVYVFVFEPVYYESWRDDERALRFSTLFWDIGDSVICDAKSLLGVLN